MQYIIDVAKKYWPEIETYSPETLDKIKTVLDQKANAGSNQDFTVNGPMEETPNYSGDAEMSHLSSVGSDEDTNSPEAQGVEDGSEFYDDKTGGVSDFAFDINEPKNPIDIDSAVTIIKSEGLSDDLEIYKRLLELVGNISGEEADKVLDTIRGTSVGVQEDSITGTGIGDGTNDIAVNPEETDSVVSEEEIEIPRRDIRKVANLVFNNIRSGKTKEEDYQRFIKSAAEHLGIDYTPQLYDEVMDSIQEWNADAGFHARHEAPFIDESSLLESIEYIISKASKEEELRDL
jgi:hypothetical protein